MVTEDDAELPNASCEQIQSPYAPGPNDNMVILKYIVLPGVVVQLLLKDMFF